MNMEQMYNKWGAEHGKNIRSPNLDEFSADLKELVETVTFEEFDSYVELRREEEQNESTD